MNNKKLSGLKKELAGLRKSAGGISPQILVSIAKRLGRKKFSRGKEPTYIREEDPYLTPLSIPGHNKDLKTGTAISIIDTLLSDVDEWEIKLMGVNNDES